MSIENLPPFIEHDIEYEDGSVITWKFFFSINRQVDGKWAVGYVHYRSDEVEGDTEMVIPQLFFINADNLSEIGVRMKAKLERFQKLSNF